MFKKITYFLLLFVLVVTLTSCKSKKPVDDPVTPPTPSYENYEYVTPETDKLKLTENYEGKEFIKDGIGVVTVNQYVDGDTTIFKTTTGETFTVRYLGINTPESTYKIEPWGFAASKYTKAALKGASKIVLQCEDIDERFDSTGKRYLAWVWLVDEKGDTRLLNLELAEKALAQAKANSTSYADAFSNAVYNVTIARCRIYGQTDPDYDYSKESKTMSLKDIRTEYSTFDTTAQNKFKGKKVTISGVVARMNGNNSCYIQQYDEDTDAYYGVYVYGGFIQRSEFAVGNTVVIEGKIGYYYGALQITDITSVKLRAWADSQNPESTVHVEENIDNNDLSTNNKDIQTLLGRFVTVRNFTVTGGSDAESNAFTIKCSSGAARIDIRIDQNIVLKDAEGNRITSWKYFEGKTISEMKVIVGYYDYNSDDSNLGYIQLLLTSMKDIQLS